MNRLETVKGIIKDNFENADCGLFFWHGIGGDSMTTVYDNDGIVIDICYHWSYFEVFGLNDTEKKELSTFYNELRRAKYER